MLGVGMGTPIVLQAYYNWTVLPFLFWDKDWPSGPDWLQSHYTGWLLINYSNTFLIQLRFTCLRMVSPSLAGPSPIIQQWRTSQFDGGNFSVDVPSTQETGCSLVDVDRWAHHWKKKWNSSESVSINVCLRIEDLTRLWVAPSTAWNPRLETKTKTNKTTSCTPAFISLCPDCGYNVTPNPCYHEFPIRMFWQHLLPKVRLFFLELLLPDNSSQQQEK